MGEVEPKPLLISTETELELYVLVGCSECKKMLRIVDMVAIEDTLNIKVEPHNCKQ